MARGRRVWIVNHYAGCPSQPTGTRHLDLARELVGAGWDVTIFAAGFSNVTRREAHLRRHRLATNERIDGVHFTWLRTPGYAGNGWRRAWNMAAFAVLFPVVQATRPAPDVILGSTVHPFAALAAWAVARLRGSRFVFEIRDLWPQTLVDLGAMRAGSPGERLLRAIEAHLVRRSDAVVTLLAGVGDYFADRGLPTNHVVYVPNGVDVAAFDAATRRPPHEAARATFDAIADLAAEGRYVLGYLGAFGRVNDLMTVVRAAAVAEARRPGTVGVVLVGDGPEAEALRNLVAATGSPVRIAGPVPRTAIPCVLSAIDAGLVHAIATPVYRYGTSFNKVHEYLAAERPVLFACSAVDDPVAAAGAGITVAPADPSAIAGAMLRLAAMSAVERRRLGAAGRRWVLAEHEIGALAGRLAGVLEGGTAR